MLVVHMDEAAFERRHVGCNRSQLGLDFTHVVPQRENFAADGAHKDEALGILGGDKRQHDLVRQHDVASALAGIWQSFGFPDVLSHIPARLGAGLIEGQHALTVEVKCVSKFWALFLLNYNALRYRYRRRR